ncbi:Zinc transporter ZIP9 [Fasciola hepatica]|uniref:Zinc transporter ZIP9 n=1 Tax=Fasciola hepatica TaxID=6192 RepID=A0A4E0RSM7_FASHE|nr:Zinc transporter ZIP9 [Fasciola hepatica]
MFMLLVDQLSAPVLQSYYCTNGLHRLIGGCCPRQLAGALGSTVQINSVSSNEAGTASDGTAERVAPGHGRMRSTATVGLVFHSFADGLALGVAFALNQIQLEMIMFVAIILHKLPAAFGLACYLVHEGFTRAQIRVHLLVFASASPLAALISYAYFVLPVGSSSSNKSDAVATKTGFALLLSGGTFLYVAASHILPELLHTTVNQQTCRPQPAQSNLSLSWHSQVNCEPSKAEDYTLYTVDAPENHVVFTIPSKQFTETGRLRPMELLVLCVGAVLPIFVSASHSH